MMGYSATDGMIISDDLLRIAANRPEDRGYLYSFLRSHHARAMMRSSKYGNVIKHLEPEHLLAIPMVTVSDTLKKTLNSAIDRCFALRSEAHGLTIAAEKSFAEALGPVDPIGPGNCLFGEIIGYVWQISPTRCLLI